MKKTIFILFFAISLFCSCTGTKVIYDTKRIATVENIQYNTINHKSKYIVDAWSTYPNIKKYKIYTDSIYNIGQNISIIGKK